MNQDFNSWLVLVQNFQFHSKLIIWNQILNFWNQNQFFNLEAKRKGRSLFSFFLIESIKNLK